MMMYFGKSRGNLTRTPPCSYRQAGQGPAADLVVGRYIACPAANEEQ
jgi:hypothetical protein